MRFIVGIYTVQTWNVWRFTNLLERLLHSNTLGDCRQLGGECSRMGKIRRGILLFSVRVYEYCFNVHIKCSWNFTYCKAGCATGDGDVDLPCRVSRCICTFGFAFHLVSFVKHEAILWLR